MEQLTKDELLAKAKEMYPIGTKFISPFSNNKFEITNDNFFLDANGNIYIIVGNYTTPYVYYNGKWAEIISTPRQHDGYIVPFDIKTWKLKEGEIILLGQKATNSYFLPHGGFVPIEIVETWEKHYPEQTEQTAKPDYTKVIELIEGEIEERKFNIENNLKDEHYGLANVNKHKINQLNLILTKIKAL